MIRRILLALLALAIIVGTIAAGDAIAPSLADLPATASAPQSPAEAVGPQVEPAAIPSLTTLEQRDEYIRRLVGPGADYTMSLRVKLLDAGYRVCERVGDYISSVRSVRWAMDEYGITPAEGWTLYRAARTILC
jgi:hypothetical protein